MTDLSGARVVYFYPDDLPTIDKLVVDELEVIEKPGFDEMETDRFGYRAAHYVVRLGRRTSGARYDDLKDKVCEIQVRTVLQDAWANFSHYLAYKHEGQIPDVLKRQINALAGALETADNAFQGIRNARDEYRRSIETSTSQRALANERTTIDSLIGYLRKRFPGKQEEPYPGFFTGETGDLILRKCPTLQDVDALLKKTERARDWLRKALDENDGGSQSPSPAQELVRAITILDPDLRSKQFLISGQKIKDMLDQAFEMT